MSNLTPDTSLALLQAGQSSTAKTSSALKNAKDAEKLNKTAIEFESVFISEMMKPMFEGLSTEAPFGGGKGEEAFRSLLLQEYGKMVSQTGSIGIADSVKEEMIKMQEQVDNAEPTTNE